MNSTPKTARLPDEVPVPTSGLTREQAAKRLAADGHNELPGQKPRSWFYIIRDVLSEPMFMLLLGAAAVYLVVGSLREALTLAASILIVIAITATQARRTDRTLSRLKDLTSPRALVVRDGVEERIAGRDVVTGDLILLREGDRVPADGTLESAVGLSIDESLLTGESLAVEKSQPGAVVYSGTLVVGGYGTCRVTGTGARSEIGRIGTSLKDLSPETTPLFREVRTIVRWVAVGGLLLCAIVAVVYGLTRGNWLEGVLAGITLAMGVLPEEFPVVLTVFLAMGAWRISRREVLTRRMPAIETIGSATLLAVDKTGTLTENRMRVALLEGDAGTIDLREADAAIHGPARDILRIAVAASEVKAFDPMERAIHEAAAGDGELATNLSGSTLVREYDLTPDLLAVTHVWSKPGHDRLEVAAKGAPETIFELCHLDATERERWAESARAHALQGLRVLGVARGQREPGSLPDSPRDFTLTFVGLLCLADPIRNTVPPALAECAAAGIRVVMITGDHPGTALSIAGQAGLDTTHGALTGDDITLLSDDELAERTAGTNIYARMKPEHKLRLIESFKANGEVVVMTGDGVNDAPALKAAHVGVAMGSRGTDVAREAAALVLMNDDFASLVGAVRLGRRIYTNIQNAMGYLLAVHLPIAGMGLLPVLLGMPLTYYPLHVLFLEFVIDPACSLVFEADPEDGKVMQRPPRSAHARLFSAQTVRRSVLMGSAALLYVFVVYALALEQLPEREARALAFIAMVAANLLMIFLARAHGDSLRDTLARPNKVFWVIVFLALAALTCVIAIPVVADMFVFAAPPLEAVLQVIAAGVLLMVAVGFMSRKRRGLQVA